MAAAATFGWQDGMLVPVRSAHDDGSTRVGAVGLAAPRRIDIHDDQRADLTGMARLTFERACLPEVASTAMIAAARGGTAP